jgi:hypothetical protein
MFWVLARAYRVLELALVAREWQPSGDGFFIAAQRTGVKHGKRPTADGGLSEEQAVRRRLT